MEKHNGNCKRIKDLEDRHNNLDRRVASWDSTAKLYRMVITVLQLIITLILLGVLITMSQLQTNIAVMKIQQEHMTSKIESLGRQGSYTQNLLKEKDEYKPKTKR